MTNLPRPPDTLPPDACCVVHAACRGDAAGVQEALDARTGRLGILGRVLGQAIPDPVPNQPARARVRLRPLPDGRLGQAIPASHELRPLAWCGLAHPAIQTAMATLPAMPRGLGSAELRTDGSRVVLAARSSRRRFARSLGTALRRLDLAVDGVAVDGRTVCGDPSLRLRVGGIRHHVSPETFTQTHLEANVALVELVRREGAGATAVLDLYAGCGNLSLPLATQGAALTLIESSESSCKDARRTAATMGLSVDVRRGDASHFAAGDAFYDLALLDPPRAGAPGVLNQVVITRPKTIIFVCCNPGYLARDLRPALQAGYELTRIEALDMFPLTEHVEVIAVLRRA